MIKFAASLCFIFLVLSPVVAQPLRLSPEDKAALESTESPDLILQVSKIPKEVLTACGKASNDPQFLMSNPGDDFKTTTNIKNSWSAKRRLVWATTFSNTFILHYESGGNVNIFHVGIFKLNPEKKEATIIWVATANRKLPSYKEFLWALKDKRLDDRFGYLG